jgi:hypothetical protein
MSRRMDKLILDQINDEIVECSAHLESFTSWLMAASSEPPIPRSVAKAEREKLLHRVSVLRDELEVEHWLCGRDQSW